MGIILNFTKNTVHGFGDPIFGEQLIKITSITETVVYFGASEWFYSSRLIFWRHESRSARSAHMVFRHPCRLGGGHH